MEVKRGGGRNMKFHGSPYAKEFGSMALLMQGSMALLTLYKQLRVPWLSLC